MCFLHMLPFHNVILFHNHCPIHSTTMFTAYPQHIHTILFTITLPSILTVLFTFTFPFTMWIFFHSYCTIDSTTMSTAYPQHIHTVLFTITQPSTLTLLFIYASFTQCDIFSQLLHNWLYNNVYSISSTYTYGIVYNYTTQYTGFAVYICFPFHNVIFSTITVQFTIQQCLQHILNIYMRYCYNYTTQYADFSVYICFPFHNVNIFLHYTVQLSIWQCLHSIFSVYMLYCLQLLSTVYYQCCLHMLSFSQCDIFPQLLHNWLYNNVYSIFSTHTYSTVHNYTTQYTDFAVYICFLHTMWHFFTITAQLTLHQCLQHIRNIYIKYCLQLLPTVYWLCCLYMLSFSQCDIFPQWLHNSLYNNVYSIFSTHTYSTVHNYTTHYTDCTV